MDLFINKIVFRKLLTIILILLPSIVLAAEKELDKITFLNVQFDSEDDLIDIIQSEENEPFDPRLIKLDKILLTNYYKKYGFLDIEVQDSIVYLRRQNKIHLFYNISEGQRYYYGGVRARGNSEIASRDIVSLFDPIKLYLPFDENQITESVKKVEDIYYNSGKPFVEMDVNYLFEQDSLIVVLLDLTENETVIIRKIRYRGLKDVKKFLIRRELTFKKGSLYNRSEMEKSQQNLYGTGLFKYVRFEMDPVKDLPGQSDLTILVQEKDPRWIGVHFGVAHEQEAFYGNKLEFTLQGGHRNLFGTARSVSLHATPSFIYDFSENRIHNPDNKLAFRFVEPWILATRTPGVLNIGYEQYRPLKSGNFDLWRTSLGVKKQISKATEFSASVSAKLVDLVGSDSLNRAFANTVQADKNQVYSLTFYWKRDNRKNLFNPKSSSYTDVSLSYSYSTGLDTSGHTETNNYLIFNASWQRYMPWKPYLPYFKRQKFTFASRLKTGMIIEPQGTGLIPINDLFFAGGATSVRGYQEQLLGPAAVLNDKGQITQAAGGKLLFLGNVEARMPLFWLFIAEVFVDGGYLWPEINAFDVRDFKFSTGLGLVLMTPLGPVRLDYGYKLIQDKTDPTPDAWHIGVYFAF